MIDLWNWWKITASIKISHSIGYFYFTPLPTPQFHHILYGKSNNCSQRENTPTSINSVWWYTIKTWIELNNYWLVVLLKFPRRYLNNLCHSCFEVVLRRFRKSASSTLLKVMPNSSDRLSQFVTYQFTISNASVNRQHSSMEICLIMSRPKQTQEGGFEITFFNIGIFNVQTCDSMSCHLSCWLDPNSYLIIWC